MVLRPWLSQGVSEKTVGKLFDLAVEVSKSEIVDVVEHRRCAGGHSPVQRQSRRDVPALMSSLAF